MIEYVRKLFGLTWRTYSLDTSTASPPTYIDRSLFFIIILFRIYNSSTPAYRYVDSRRGLPQGRTSTSHLATDPGSRPSAAQPRTELSMATCPGQRTMEAACRETATYSGQGLARVDDDDDANIMLHTASVCFCVLLF